MHFTVYKHHTDKFYNSLTSSCFHSLVGEARQTSQYEKPAGHNSSTTDKQQLITFTSQAGSSCPLTLKET